MDSNQIFRNDFVSIHYHLGDISSQIIKCNFFSPEDLLEMNFLQLFTLWLCIHLHSLALTCMALCTHLHSLAWLYALTCTHLHCAMHSLNTGVHDKCHICSNIPWIKGEAVRHSLLSTVLHCSVQHCHTQYTAVSSTVISSRLPSPALSYSAHCSAQHCHAIPEISSSTAVRSPVHVH